MTQETALKGCTKEAAEAVSHAIGEPDWARERRIESWRVFEDTPMPKRTDEQWRRTDLSALNLDAIASYLPGPALSALPGLLQRRLEVVPLRAGLVAQVNSQGLAVPLTEELRKKGVIFISLEQALREHPELVAPYLLVQGIRPTYSKFAALNGAFWSGGTFLYVPANVVVEAPFISARWLDAGAGSILPRIIVVLEAGSSIRYLENSASESHQGQALHCGVTEIFLKEGAELDYLSVQEWGRDVWDLSMTRVSLGRDSRFRSLSAVLGSRLSRVHFEAALEGAGAEARLQGFYIGDSRQHFDFRTLQDHASPHTTSDLLFKGALKDRASAAYEGTVRVRRGAIHTSANQTNHNLLLNPGSKADSLPVLEIEASDIDRCNHGATVGQVDEEQLFYLMSRGLNRREAYQLIVAGFFEPLIAQVPYEALRTRIGIEVDQKVARSVEEAE